MKMELFRNRSLSKRKSRQERQEDSSSETPPPSSPAASTSALGELDTSPSDASQSPAHSDTMAQKSPSSLASKNNHHTLDEMDDIVAGVATNLSISSSNSRTPTATGTRYSPVFASKPVAPYSPSTPGATARVIDILDSDDSADEIFMDEDDEDIVAASAWENSNVSSMLAAAARSPTSIQSSKSLIDAMPKSSPMQMMSRNKADAAQSKVSAAANHLLPASPKLMKDLSISDSDNDNDEKSLSSASSTGSSDEKESQGKDKSGQTSDSGEDYTDDEDEGEDGYKPGGYHRVNVGEVYNQR